MQLGDLSSSLLDLLVGMTVPVVEDLPEATADAPAFAQQLSAALASASTLGSARPLLPPSEDVAETGEDPIGSELGVGPLALDVAVDHPVELSPWAAAPSAPAAGSTEAAAAGAPAATREPARAPSTPTLSPVVAIELLGAPASQPTAGPAGPAQSLFQSSALLASSASRPPADPGATSNQVPPDPSPAPIAGAAAVADPAVSSPSPVTELRAVVESAAPAAPSNDGRPEVLPRTEWTTLLERIELRPAGAERAAPSLRASLRPEDLGRSLATRALSSIEPTESSRAAGLRVLGLTTPAAGPLETDTSRSAPAASRSDSPAPTHPTPVAPDAASPTSARPAAPAPIAPTTPGAAIPAVGELTSSAAPAVSPAESVPAVAPTPADPVSEKESSPRPESAARPSGTAVAATAGASSVSQGEGGSSRSATDGDSSSQGEAPPTSAPAPGPDSAAPTPIASPRGADLQMQAQQAVARTVVRMGEDQLLASARPQTATVQLRPSHLGALQIEVHQTPQRTLEVSLVASVPETQRALEADADDILDALRSQKLDVSRVSVRGEGERPDGEPRNRNDFFRNRDPRDPSFAEGEGDPNREGGQHPGDGRHPSHADPTDYRYWEAVR